MKSRFPFGRTFRTLTLAGLGFAFATAVTLSECSAQSFGSGRPSSGGSGSGSSMGGSGSGSSTGGSGSGGSSTGGTGGSTAGSFSGQPGNTAAGEIGRSAERRFTDTGDSGQGGRSSTSGFGGGRGFGGFGGLGGFGGFGGNAFGMGNSASSKPTVRARLAGPVEVPAEMRIASQVRTEQQIRVTPAQRFVRGYSAVNNDGVATISGTVSSEKERRMAELLLKLEPGVRRVENQITVSP